MALEYYAEGNCFWQPSVHNLAGEGTGKAAGEFPVLYFLVAQLWKIFGYHEYIFRLTNILILFLALFFLFRIVENILKDSFWAIATALLLFTSPLLVYYTNNFLPNVAALSLSIIGLCFFVKYFSSQS